MITIDKERVIIPRATWDRLVGDQYFDELVENLLDSEELIEAVSNSEELVDLREYDRIRRPNKI